MTSSANFRDREEHVRAYAEQAADALLVFNQAGRFIDVNPHACSSLGYSRDELLCMSVSDVHPEFDLPLAQVVWETIIPDHPLYLLTQQRRKDGTTFPVEMQFSIFFDVQGTRRYMVLARDITGRNPVETAVRESENTIRAVANSIPQMAHIARAGGFSVWYNQRWYDYTGTTPEDMECSQSVNDHEFLPQVMAQWKAAIAAGEPFKMALPLRGADGRFRQVLTWAVPVKNAPGEIVQWAATNTDVEALIIDAIRNDAGVVHGFTKITRDITEMKRAEQAQREKQPFAEEVDRQRVIAEELDLAGIYEKTNKLLNAIIDSCPIGICTVSASGVIEIYNPACERIYGYSAAEMVGRSRQDMYEKMVIESEAPAEHSSPLVISSAEDNPREVRRRRKDGTIVDVSLVQTARFDADGSTLGFLYLITDVTERKAMEERLRQSQKMEAMGQLAGGVAHDFNNLLTIVICNLELMIESSPSDSEVQISGRMALDASLRGAELIEQMLAFARKQRLEQRIVSVNALVNGMTNMLRRSLGEQIEITLRMAPDPWSTELDPAQMQTALANLATNARDAMPRGGSLVIETANTVLDEEYVGSLKDVAAGDYVLISVSDSGVGMPPEVAARAFDPFFTTKPVGHGTGLGLSMVFGFVKQSNGHIRIHSEEGRGTTIKLYLPRAKSAEVQKPVADPTPTLNLAGTILVVEDNIDVAKSIEGMLRRAGFSPIVAHSAKAALDKLDAGNGIDLLFTDVVLAGEMNGIELASEASSRRPGLKILFTSGFAESALMVIGKTMVSDRMLSKPYKRADLLAKIAQALTNGHHSSGRES